MNQATDQIDRPKLPPGTVARDTYTIIELLGSGRFADAYLVRHRYMGLQVMKILVDGLSDEDRIEGLNEAFMLSRIAHPGIVRVFDANRIDESLGGHPYITMEYVAGGTLEEYIRDREDDIDVAEAMEIGRQIAVATGHAHDLDESLVHRDIKPANVLLETAGSSGPVIRLADFGLACRLSRFTQVAKAGGTILYMSPESIRGYEVQASDVFSTSLVLYELLAGTSPYPRSAFADVDSSESLQKVLSGLHGTEPAPPSYFNPNVTPDMDSVVMRGLCQKELLRFHSGNALAHAIEACQHADRARQSDLTADIVRTSGDAAAEAFRIAHDPSSLAEAADLLEALIDLHPEAARVYLPHVRQMRVQWNRCRQVMD